MNSNENQNLSYVNFMLVGLGTFGSVNRQITKTGRLEDVTKDNDGKFEFNLKLMGINIDLNRSKSNVKKTGFVNLFNIEFLRKFYLYKTLWA